MNQTTNRKTNPKRKKLSRNVDIAETLNHLTSDDAREEFQGSFQCAIDQVLRGKEALDKIDLELQQAAGSICRRRELAYAEFMQARKTLERLCYLMNPEGGVSLSLGDSKFVVYQMNPVVTYSLNSVNGDRDAIIATLTETKTAGGDCPVRLDFVLNEQVMSTLVASGQLNPNTLIELGVMRVNPGAPGNRLIPTKLGEKHHE